MFLDIDEIMEMLEQIADTVPEDFFRGLNLGIALLEDVKFDKQHSKFLVLGEYEISELGRGIKIYYGSLKMNMDGYSREQIRDKLEEIVYHEFTHHLEHLAGERGLEIKDAQWIRENLEGK